MRRAATVLLGTLAIAGALSVPAHAVPDPTATLTCVTGTPADVAGLVDPASPAVPTEVPLTHCVAP
ncbi:hypothetical protein ACFS5L_33395 [Streptomyces phyllanthi]|uniref:Uncharacterized protein n=1 Tax=Streptomyces phyllanthi TaxID=1803180 RepID=A0A5N8W026_9ACTN|nr:hypothetical protein [Streptomyces phyllanthi]MPY40860.1 hypothetical protein [Streptomyces phyllanthi]